MTLEDFFTLTEMKNGLATLARVEELISVIQQQKDFIVNNVSDAARQWLSVACTLAATENKDCLNHFIKLNGLCYLNHWLQEALKYINDATDFAAEELVKSLLGSLERLPIFREDLAVSGIQSTVEQLVGYRSLEIKEKALALSQRWMQARENTLGFQDLNKEASKVGNCNPPTGVVCTVGVNLTRLVSDSSTHTHTVEENNCGEESAEAACHSGCSNVTGCLEASQLDNTNGGLTSMDKQIMSSSSSNSVVTNASLEDVNALASAFVPNTRLENLSGTEDSSLCHAADVVFSATCCSNASRDNADGRCDASEPTSDSSKDMKTEVDTNVGSPSKSCQIECCRVPSSSGLSSSSDAHKPGCSVSCNFDAKEIKSCTLETTEMLPRPASIDCVVPKCLKNLDLKPDMQDLLSNGSNVSKLRVENEPGISLDGKEEVGSTSEVKKVGTESRPDSHSVDSVVLRDFSKQADKKSTVEMDEQSELKLEYGEIDALEVARQVAIEVEREVVDYREPFCSSSPDANSAEDLGPQCYDDQHDPPANKEKDGRGLPFGSDLDDASSPKDDNSKATDIGRDKCEKDVGMSKGTTHESCENTDQNRCVFDLNEDICVEESDSLMQSTPSNTIHLPAPIAVAASKGAPNLPASPIRFEGELGWKGSAATSAFRPPFPRRTPDIEKTSSGNKRKANTVEFDLNVAESGDDVVEPMLVDLVPISPGVLSRDDSTEVSSRRADRLKLDLNRLGDDDISPFPSSWSLLHQNGAQTVSPASSSSSRQPTAKNFDLNDNLIFFDPMPSHNLSRCSSKALGIHGSSKHDDPVITIMGSKITQRKDHMDEAPLSLAGNRPTTEPNVMVSRSLMPYGHVLPPGYGYNGHLMGPPMPFPAPFYGPGSMPYMVDSRGAAVAPQILSASGFNAPPPPLPTVLMSMPNSSPCLNGAGTSQSAMDLNSGFMSLEAGTRESGSFRNFFAQGDNGLMEVQARPATQAGVAGGSVNRKEADSGWEQYGFGYKHVRSWQ